MKKNDKVVFIGESSLKGKKGKFVNKQGDYNYIKVKGSTGLVLATDDQVKKLTRAADIPVIGWLFGKS